MAAGRGCFAAAAALVFGALAPACAWAQLGSPPISAELVPVPQSRPQRAAKSTAQPAQPGFEQRPVRNGPAATEANWKAPGSRTRPPAQRQPGSGPVVIAPIGEPSGERLIGDELRPTVDPDRVPPALPSIVAQKPRKGGGGLDPWAPLGLRLGAFEVSPFIEQSVGYDSNPNLVAGPRQSSTVLRTEAGLSAQSDWSVHEVQLDLRGAYSFYPDAPAADRPEGDARLRLRLDMDRDTAIDFGVNANLTTQQPGTVEQPVIGLARADILGVGAAAGVTRQIGPATAVLRATINHFDYADLDCDGCAETDQSFRNYTAYGGLVKLGYEVHPGFRPFIAGTVDQRVYDDTPSAIPALAALGSSRDSLGASARIGIAMDVSGLLRGEVSVGYGARQSDNPNVADLRGALVDASLVWTPTGLTTVTVTAANSLGDSSIATSAGSYVQGLGVEIAHLLRRNVTLTGFATAARTNYLDLDQDETGTSAGLRLDYKLNRSLSVRASFIRQWLTSSFPNGDYTANTLLVGLRFQP